MKQIVNDEVETPLDLMENRTPTHVLRFRGVGHGRILLEQLWESPLVGINPQWVPVPMCDTQNNA